MVNLKEFINHHLSHANGILDRENDVISNLDELTDERQVFGVLRDWQCRSLAYDRHASYIRCLRSLHHRGFHRSPASLSLLNSQRLNDVDGFGIVVTN